MFLLTWLRTLSAVTTTRYITVLSNCYFRPWDSPDQNSVQSWNIQHSSKSLLIPYEIKLSILVSNKSSKKFTKSKPNYAQLSNSIRISVKSGQSTSGTIFTTFDSLFRTSWGVKKLTLRVRKSVISYGGDATVCLCIPEVSSPFNKLWNIGYTHFKTNEWIFI